LFSVPQESNRITDRRIEGIINIGFIVVILEFVVFPQNLITPT